jgi:hypothetical protein
MLVYQQDQAYALRGGNGYLRVDEMVGRSLAAKTETGIIEISASAPFRRGGLDEACHV